jgi:hypothetical protein
MPEFASIGVLAMKTLLAAGALALGLIGSAGCEPGDYYVISFNGTGVSFLIVAGNVRVSPIQPVEQGDTPNDAPYPGAHVRVESLDGDRIMEIVSDQDGRFAMQLAPGTYRFVPLPPAGAEWPQPPAAIELTIDRQRRDLLFTYDTGIR